MTLLFTVHWGRGILCAIFFAVKYRAYPYKKVCYFSFFIRRKNDQRVDLYKGSLDKNSPLLTASLSMGIRVVESSTVCNALSYMALRSTDFEDTQF